MLLVLRRAIKSDIQISNAQLLYGTALHLPSHLLTNDVYKPPSDPTYVSKLYKSMRKLFPINPAYNINSIINVQPSLEASPTVFLRIFAG